MDRLLDCTLLLVLCAVAALAQYEGDFGAPAPPRLQIPGAVSLGPAPPRRPPVGGARIQGRRQPAPQPPQQSFEDAPRFRNRGPGARAGRLPLSSPAPAPTPAPQFFSPPPPQRVLPQPEENLPPRPVVEEAEDDYEEEAVYSPSPSPSTPPPPPPPPPQPQRPAPSPSPLPSFRPERPLPVFRPERPAVLPTPSPELNYVSPTRQQLRPTALPDDEDVRQRKPLYKDQQYTSRNKVRPTPAAVEQPQFSRQPTQQSQQQFNRAQAVVRAPPKQVFATSGKDGFEKPERQYQRPRKPVAQVLRRYREDNDDGSITWGFENDDGSFKEETIGTDCVTYGKYGYIDPDGTRREYTYSTGIPCDKTDDPQTQGSEGYIDYAENKYVLPTGEKIDLNKMGKTSRRTAVAQQQQQYRS